MATKPKAKQKNTAIKELPPLESTPAPVSKFAFTIVKPQKPESKSAFALQLDDDLQYWIRGAAMANEVTIGEVVHQALYFARKHAARSKT